MPTGLPRLAPAALVPKKIADDGVVRGDIAADLNACRGVETEDVRRGGCGSSDRVALALDNHADHVAQIRPACIGAEEVADDTRLFGSPEFEGLPWC